MSTIDNPHMMEESSPRQVIIRYGLIGGLVAIAYGLIAIITGMNSPSNGQMGGMISTLVSLSIYVVFLVLAVREYRDKHQGGFITFGKAFRVAFLTGLMIAVLSFVFNYLYFNLVDTEFVANMIAETEGVYVDQGMSDEQIEMSLKIVKFMFSSAGQLVMLGVSALFGAIPCLIIAGIMKKEPETAV